MRDRIISILLLGFLIRVGFSLVGFHPDIQALDLAGQVLKNGHILDLYDYLPSLPADHPIREVYPTYLFNYPPAVYLFFGLTSPLSDLLISPHVHQTFLLNVTTVLGRPEVNLHLLLIKLPYIAFDFLIALMLMSLVWGNRLKWWVLTLWIINPVNIYATYLIGQFDIIPTFFVILSLYLVIKGKKLAALDSSLLSALALGVGAAFKIYPLLLLIPLSSVKSEWRPRLLTIFSGLAVYLLTILPFISSRGFRSTALVANQLLKSFYPQIAVSGGENIILFLGSVVFVYIFFLYHQANLENIWKRYFITLLLFFIFTHYHPQWFLWITPFFILELIESRFKYWLLIALALFSFVGLLFFFDPGLTTRIFSPAIPSLSSSADIWTMLRLNVDFNLLRSILHTVFVGVGIYLIYVFFSKSKAGEP